MSYLIYQILKLKSFIIWTCAAGLVLMVVFLLWTVRAKRGPKQYRAQAIFYGRTAVEIVYMNALILQFVFAVSSVFGQVEIERIHICAVAVLWCIRTVSKPRLMAAVTDALYDVLMTIILLVCNLITGFMAQTGGDIWLTSMYLLLNIFMIELAIYYLVYSLRPLLDVKEVKVTAVKRTQYGFRKGKKAPGAPDEDGSSMDEDREPAKDGAAGGGALWEKP